MTNKKKQGSAVQKQKKQEAKKTAKAEQQKRGEAPPAETQTTNHGVFTQPQLTAIVFLSMGVSRLMEWKRALDEVVTQQQHPSDSSGNNGTTEGLCQAYMLTNDSVDYDSVCNSPVAATLMRLKFDLSLQLVAMVIYLVVRCCWYDEAAFDRLNACLTLAPVTTTLLLLQVCRSFITPQKAMHLSLTIVIMTAVAGSATARVVREVLQGRSNDNQQQQRSSSRGRLQSLCLSSMVFLHVFEIYQWWRTSQVGSADGSSTTSVLALSTLSGDNWNDAWKVFMYTMMMDKFTVALLLLFAWFGLEEQRQRRFLLCFAIVKGLEYAVQMEEYNEDDFTDLPSMKTAALTCSIISGVAWMTPSFGGGTGKKKVA